MDVLVMSPELAPSDPDVEKLETMIYEADAYARTLEVAKLEPVVRHLRRALAHIVLAFDEEG